MTEQEMYIILNHIEICSRVIAHSAVVTNKFTTDKSRSISQANLKIFQKELDKNKANAAEMYSNMGGKK